MYASIFFPRFQQKMATPDNKPKEQMTTPSVPEEQPTKLKGSPVVDTSKGFESTDGGSTPDDASVGRKLSSKFSGFLSKNKESPQQKKKKVPSPKSLTPS